MRCGDKFRTRVKSRTIARGGAAIGNSAFAWRSRMLPAVGRVLSSVASRLMNHTHDEFITGTHPGSTNARISRRWSSDMIVGTLTTIVATIAIIVLAISVRNDVE